MEYAWPGNVREIENAVERATVLCRDNQLTIDDFPREVRNLTLNKEKFPVIDSTPYNLPDQMDEIERKLIQQALEECNGQAATAARKLGISRQSLLYKLNKFDVNL